MGRVAPHRRPGGRTMSDVVFVGLTLIFFGLSWALVASCDCL